MYLLKLEQDIKSLTSKIFTFHYVSIKTVLFAPMLQSDFNLHSTMYLLKLSGAVGTVTSVATFTFHYVSIKT